MKPDPHIYGLATEQLNVKPRDCLYVADGIGGELAGNWQLPLKLE